MNWHAIYTRIRAEQAACKAIHDLGFPVYLPLEKKRINHRSGKHYSWTKPKVIETALFPRYGFVQFGAFDTWTTILDVKEVVNILRSGDKPLPIEDFIIDGLRMAENLGLFDCTRPPQIGSRVRAIEGPFRDIVGRIVRVRSAERIDILMDLFGGERLVTMPLAALREA